MPKSYFSFIPEFDYASRLPDAKTISDSIPVKNLFRRGKLREDILQNLNYFTKYKIIGDDRPDNVANELYGNPYLDWIILLSNNMMNVETEWPMTQESFENYLLKKYTTDENIYAAHHYETQEIKNGAGKVILAKGFEVPKDFTMTYHDENTGTEVIATNITDEISNYTYEERRENDKRNIFCLKGSYVGLVMNDMENIMQYKPGSTQYVNSKLIKGQKIRLFS